MRLTIVAAALAVPVNGTVAATWENFPVTGKLCGKEGEINIKSDCGGTAIG